MSRIFNLALLSCTPVMENPSFKENFAKNELIAVHPCLVKHSVANCLAEVSINAVNVSIGSNKQTWITKLAFSRFQIADYCPFFAFVWRMGNTQWRPLIVAVVKRQKKLTIMKPYKVNSAVWVWQFGRFWWAPAFPAIFGNNSENLSQGATAVCQYPSIRKLHGGRLN